MKELAAKMLMWAVACWVILCAVATVWMVLVGLGGVVKIFTNDPLAVLFWAGFIVLGCLVKWGWRKWVG
jgi:hypothetical protein